jgi:hypothetical protein
MTPNPQAGAQPVAQKPAPTGDKRTEEAFTRVMLAASKILYEKATSDGIIKMLRSGPAGEAIAQTALFVMKTLYDESQGKIPPQIMLRAALAVVNLLAELAVAAGMKLSGEDGARAGQLVSQSLGKRFGANAQQPSAPQQAQQAPAAPAQAAPAQAAPAQAPVPEEGIEEEAETELPA